MNTIIKKAEIGVDDYSVGVYPQRDGSFLAMTASWSKTFKTYKGAEIALNKRLGK